MDGGPAPLLCGPDLDHLKPHPNTKTLPPVLPIVLAQEGKAWAGSTWLSDLIQIPPEHETALRPWQPELVFKLIELVRIPDFRSPPKGVLTLRALKAEPVDELLLDPVWAPDTLESISRDPLERFLRDVYDRDLRRDTFMKRVTSFEHSTSLKNQLRALAEQFCEEGREEGQRQGEQQRADICHACSGAAGRRRSGTVRCRPTSRTGLRG